MVFFCICFATLLTVFSCTTKPKNNDPITLNSAITVTAEQLAADLGGKKVAVVAFVSGSEALSDYIIDELSRILVNSRAVTVVDRRELDLVREELEFNLSGEVSDESAQAVGKMLGAQAVISGTLTELRSSYRFSVKAINVESAALGSAMVPGTIGVYLADRAVQESAKNTEKSENAGKKFAFFH
jgi:TolB-like protein